MHFLEMLPLISAAVKKNNEKYGAKCFTCLDLMLTRTRCEYNFIKRKIVKLEKIGEIRKVENCNISDRYLSHTRKLQKAVFNHNLKNARPNFYALAGLSGRKSSNKTHHNKANVLFHAKSSSSEKCWKRQNPKNTENDSGKERYYE